MNQAEASKILEECKAEIPTTYLTSAVQKLHSVVEWLVSENQELKEKVENLDKNEKIEE